MVDFNAAAKAVRDPNADPVFLAKIAYENPEFGANVVANPRAYPGLKRWVAEFGDERARQYLRNEGWPVPDDESSASSNSPAQNPSEKNRNQPKSKALDDDDASDPYTNPSDLADVADVADEVEYEHDSMQSRTQQRGATVADNARQPLRSFTGYSAELAMTTRDLNLMAQIAQDAPELRPCLARNPYIYPELLDWLARLNDSAINAAIRLRDHR